MLLEVVIGTGILDMVFGDLRRIGISGLLALATLCLGGCGESHTWHQKMTIEVDTPQGAISASNVVKVGWAKNDAMSAANGPDWNYAPRGEAVVIEMPDRRYMFALVMQDEYAGNIFGQILFNQDGRVWGSDKFKAISGHKGVLAVPVSKAPVLVTFADINDPKTVQRVDPANLASTFGLGFALKDIRLEITEEPITDGIVARVLGWLGEFPEPGLCPATGQVKDIPLCREVTQGDIIRR